MPTRGLLLAISLGVLVSWPIPEASNAEPDERPPNIIVLLTDDQRWDGLGAAGNAVIETPHLDALARRGVYFRNAYVTSSICTASRASILSGQYARRHGIWNGRTSFSDTAFAETYPMVLRRAGYRTGFIGKFGVGRDVLPEEHFDYWRGFGGQGRYTHRDSLGRPVHLTRLIGDQAIAFLQQHPDDQPFALSISFKAPHGPRINYDPAYADLYASTVIPAPSTRHAGALFDPFFKTNNLALRTEQELPSERLTTIMKNYYRLITGVDVTIGRIRAALERLHLADNTVILFTSDNGSYLGTHGMMGKWYGHNASIRVPFILYDPRLPAEQQGQIRDEIVLNVDVAPSLLALANVPVPDRMQGADITTLLNQEPVTWREDFFYEFLLNLAGILKSEGVVEKRYKLLQYIERDPPFEQLYDLEQDSLEVINVAADPAYASVRQRLRTRLDVFRRVLQ